MPDETPVQLSFEVGGEPPTAGVFSLSGRPFVHRELMKGEEVHLQIVDADGEVVADGYGRVLGVAFKDVIDKETKMVVRTERIHTVKVS